MIRLRGVRERNLAGLDLELPAHRWVAFVGPSGSGKSTLLFDVVDAEARRRLLGALGVHGPWSLEGRSVALDEAQGLPPTVAVRGRSAAAGARSTVASAPGLAEPLRRLFAGLAAAHCPSCGVVLPWGLPSEHVDRLIRTCEGQRLLVLAPSRADEAAAEAMLRWRQGGYTRCWSQEGLKPLEETRPGEAPWLVVDRLRLAPASRARLLEALETAFEEGEGRAAVLPAEQSEAEPMPLASRPWCARCALVLPQPTPGLFTRGSVLGACERCGGRGRLDGATCGDCEGLGLRSEARAWRLLGQDIGAWWAEAASEALERLRRLPEDVDASRLAPLQGVHGQALAALEALCDLGLGYLALGRSFDSLSSGERRRARLAARLAAPMPGVLYLLDEPFEGLHPGDLDGLLSVLRRLRAQGAGVWVAGHEPRVLEAAEWVVELGPGAGLHGGRLVAQGTPEQLRDHPTATVARWLSGRWPLPARRSRRVETWLRVEGAEARNLRGFDVAIPLGALTAVVGPSGSGKSTLLFEVLAAAVGGEGGAGVGRVQGARALAGVETFRAEPPPRNPRSVVATAVGIFDDLRAHFAALPEARMRGWKAGRFSFNAAGGRCERCRGEGTVPVEPAWLQEERMTCPACEGRRYDEGTLGVRWRGLSIADVLALRVEEAAPLFEALPRVARTLQALLQVGLGHVPLGRSVASLSAGEMQRLRLATLLGRRRRKGTLLLLDEPASGLHPADVDRLVAVFDALLDEGHTVVVTDHRLRLAAVADHVLELGPGGGPAGGRLLAAGSPAEVAAGATPSAPWLRGLLD